jgi:hypothetical protein
MTFPAFTLLRAPIFPLYVHSEAAEPAQLPGCTVPNATVNPRGASARQPLASWRRISLAARTCRRGAPLAERVHAAVMPPNE